MSRENLPLLGLLFLLMIGGLILGQQFWVRSAPALEGETNSFRQWFWQSRSLDLIVQVGLFFCGALGIAALLPRDREDEEG